MIAAATRSAALGSMLALGACAAAASPQVGRDIVWESERVKPSDATPQASSAGPPGLDADGCREFTQTIRIAGEEHQAFGRACLQQDGSWRIVGPAAAPGQAPAQAPAVAYPVPAYRYYAPPVFFGSAFFFSDHHRHKHHGHHHFNKHRHSGGGHFRHHRGR
jgi:hypothetical protein